MLFGKKDPRLRPADDSFRRLTAMNFAFSGLNAFVCAWAITPPNAPSRHTPSTHPTPRAHAKRTRPLPLSPRNLLGKERKPCL